MTIAIAIGVGLFAAFVRLNLFYSHKFFDITGRAEWIWQRWELSRGVPIAFFATRDFDLPENRYFTKIKIAGDPQYAVYFNGVEIGGRAVGEERRLDVYDVSRLAHTGSNRIVVAMRSANGVGGLLVAVDISPETANYVVSDSSWRVVRGWRSDLLLRDPSGWEAPMLLGEPPVGRWNYLEPFASRFTTPPRRVISPRQSLSFKTALPEVKVVSGVAIASSKRVRATAFDFGGFLDGRAKLTMNYEPQVSHIVTVRFANIRAELSSLEGNVYPFVFAAGERTVIDPQVRHFRYIVIYGGEATAEVAE